MQNDNKILDIILKRFPDYRDSIYDLFEESDSFRSLCEGYYECKRIIDLSTGTFNKNYEVSEGYKILIAEIEQELSERISD